MRYIGLDVHRQFVAFCIKGVERFNYTPVGAGDMPYTRIFEALAADGYRVDGSLLLRSTPKAGRLKWVGHSCPTGRAGMPGPRSAPRSRSKAPNSRCNDGAKSSA